jgi:hypothetical protein
MTSVEGLGIGALETFEGMKKAMLTPSRLRAANTAFRLVIFA